jgi:hypothetical protein
MADALRNHDDLAASFANEYRVRAGQVSGLPTLEILVARACGGCPGCRRARRRPAAGFVPVPSPVPVVDRLGPPISEYFHEGTTDVVLVLVEDARNARTGRRLRRAVAALVAEGLRSVVAPRDRIEAWRDVLASQPVAVTTEWQPTALPDITTAVLALDDDLAIRPVDVLRFGPPRLVFVDAEEPDPQWPHQKLAARSHVMTLDQLLEGV